MLYSLLKKLTPVFLKEVATDFAWRKVALTTQLASGLHVEITSPGEWYVFNEVFVNQVYDAAIHKALESSGGTLNVLDLGANVGMFTLRLFDLAKERGRIRAVLVEGAPSVHRELERRLSTQPLPHQNIQTINALAGQKSGREYINVNKHPVNSSVHARTETVERIAVDYMDLNPLFDSIDLLKCDIEGAELEFIETYPGLLSKTRVAIFELHHELCDTVRCLDLLSRSGFSKQIVISDDEPAISLHLFWRDS